MIGIETQPRPSRQVRAFDTGHDEPHPRAVQLADAMLDIAALGSGVGFKDLIRAGFTAAEITEFHAEAEKLATSRRDKQVSLSPDRLEDIRQKVREPLPNAPPLPERTPDTQALYLAWGKYCAARSAYRLDPWSGQRERCLEVLYDYLRRLPILPRERKLVVRAAAEAIQILQ